MCVAAVTVGVVTVTLCVLCVYETVFLLRLSACLVVVPQYTLHRISVKSRH